MKKEIRIASILNIIANIFLFLAKITIGFVFGAISILGDAINSLADVVTSIMIYFTIKINNKEADVMHPFGHTRAENIAGYTTGIFMIILGFTIATLSLKNLVNKISIEYNTMMLIVVGLTLIIKFGLYLYIKNILSRNNSPALKANLQDHLNDIIIILGVFLAIVGLRFGVWWIDPFIGLLISIYVIKEGWNIALENIHHLMGIKANNRITNEITNLALSVDGVFDINTLLAQYLGNKVQVEIHIEVDEKLNVKVAHDIGKKVQNKIESHEKINNCFVHIDVYNKKNKHNKNVT